MTKRSILIVRLCPILIEQVYHILIELVYHILIWAGFPYPDGTKVRSLSKKTGASGIRISLCPTKALGYKRILPR